MQLNIRWWSLLPCAGALAFAGACSQPASETNTSSDPAATPAVAGVVQWPHLKALDDLAEDAEAQADKGDLTALRQLDAKIVPAARLVAQDPLPQYTHEPEQVKLTQKDLSNLADSLADSNKIAEADLRQGLAAVHPIVAKLMESSGLPHIHEHPDQGGANAKPAANDHLTTH